jgi:hypothetical protein
MSMMQANIGPLAVAKVVPLSSRGALVMPAARIALICSCVGSFVRRCVL